MSYDAPAFLAPEFLPDALTTASALTRPVLARGGAPGAVALLAEVEARGLVSALLAPTQIVAPGQVSAEVAVSRAMSPAGGVTLETAADGSLVAIGATGAAFGAAPRRLLVRVPGQNRVRNPRAAGATIGSYTPTANTQGNLPTNWQTRNTVPANLQVEVIAVGQVDGIDRIRLRLFGAGVSAGTYNIVPDITRPAVPGDVSACAVFFNQIGAPTGVSAVALQQIWLTAGGGGLATTTLTIAPGTGAIADARRSVVSAAAAPATTAESRFSFRWTITAGTVNATYDIGLPSIELVAAPTAPMAPAVGSPASQQRGADLPVWTPPGGWPARGAIVLSGVLGSVSGANPFGLLQLDAGADANRIVARTVAGSGLVEALVVTSGVTVATLSPTGALAAGTPMKVLLGWSPTGVVLAHSAGGLARATVARPPGLYRGLLGHAAADASRPMGGELLADFHGFFPSDAEARALVAI